MLFDINIILNPNIYDENINNWKRKKIYLHSPLFFHYIFHVGSIDCKLTWNGAVLINDQCAAKKIGLDSKSATVPSSVFCVAVIASKWIVTERLEGNGVIGVRVTISNAIGKIRSQRPGDEKLHWNATRQITVVCVVGDVGDSASSSVQCVVKKEARSALPSFSSQLWWSCFQDINVIAAIYQIRWRNNCAGAEMTAFGW